MIDKKVMTLHFSKQAKEYDTYAKIQKDMALELLTMINFDKIKDNLTILDIGCGTGYLTEQLLLLFPNARITAVDIAPGMIEFARKKFSNKQVDFKCLDIEEAELDQKFDLIISNATFQWFNDLKSTLAKLNRMLEYGGILAFSTFGDKTFNELHTAYRIAKEKQNISTNVSPGQKFFDLKTISNMCETNLDDNQLLSFQLVSKEKYEYEYYESVMKFLKSVKKVGANNSNSQRHINLSLTKDMINIYEKIFHDKEFVQVTYHCIYLCWNKLKKKE